MNYCVCFMLYPSPSMAFIYTHNMTLYDEKIELHNFILCFIHLPLFAAALAINDFGFLALLPHSKIFACSFFLEIHCSLWVIFEENLIYFLHILCMLNDFLSGMKELIKLNCINLHYFGWGSWLALPHLTLKNIHLWRHHLGGSWFLKTTR